MRRRNGSCGALTERIYEHPHLTQFQKRPHPTKLDLLQHCSHLEGCHLPPVGLLPHCVNSAGRQKLSQGGLPLGSSRALCVCRSRRLDLQVSQLCLQKSHTALLCDDVVLRLIRCSTRLQIGS